MQDLKDVETAKAEVQPPMFTVPPTPVDSVTVKPSEGDQESSTSHMEGHDVDEYMSCASMDSFQFSDDGINLPAEEGDAAISKPLNIAHLKECIEAGSSTLEKIVDKDVCLVLGKTGSGKSTLLQGIAGKKYEAKVFAIEGETMEKVVYDVVDALDGFKIGHDKVSQTSSIQCLERKVDMGNALWYVDSPGWEDTNGHEVDIATSVMLRQVAERAKSLRFVILINYNSLMESRGDALRAILKIVHSFVHDFEESKQSFCFLFSHTDAYLPEDVTSARLLLKGEIVHTEQGTKEEGVKAVLRFIKQSLEKNYPFAQIFHPLRTDMRKFAKFIHSKLKPECNPVTSGGLTTAAQLRLRSQLQSMRLNVKHLLTQSPIKTEEIQQIQETLACLEKYINSADVRTAVEECTDAIERFSLQESLIVDELISRGTSMESSFTTADIDRLRLSMQQLIALEGLSEEHFAARLRHRLKEFHQTILGQKSFHDAGRNLDKLRVWADAFDHEEIYAKCIEYYNGLLALCNDILTDCNFDKLEDIDEDDVKILNEAFRLLPRFSDESLARHSLNIEKTKAALSTLRDRFQSAFSLCCRDLGDSLPQEAFPSELLELLSKRARVLGLVISHVFSPVCSDLKEKAAELLKLIRSRVVELYEDAARRWTVVLLTKDSFLRIEQMKSAVSYFQDLEWKELDLSCKIILGRLHSSLSHQIQDVNFQADQVRKYGITQGQSMATGLLSLNRCLAFDELLDFEDRSVLNSSTRIHRVYKTRGMTMKKQIDEIFVALLDPTKSSSMSLEGLKAALPEIKEITCFCSVLKNKEFKDMEDIERSVNTRLLEFLRQMRHRSELLRRRWKEALEGSPNVANLEKEAYKVVGLLYDMTKVLEMDVSDFVRNESEAILLHVSSTVASFTESVDNHFTNSGNFQLIAECFACFELLTTFPAIKTLLPSAEELRLKATTFVCEKAKKIEDLVEQTAEWDTIDSLIGELEAATVLDAYTCGQASSRLGPLRKLRSQKEGQVDSLVQSLIIKEDFKGIGEFLTPLATSKDQLKRQKFQKLGKQIYACLKDHIDFICNHLNTLAIDLNQDNMPMIAKRLGVIEDAAAQLGPDLKNMSIDLNMTIRRIHRLIDKRLQTYIDNFCGAYKEQNYTRMAVSKWRAKLYVLHLCDKAPQGANNQVDKLEVQYKQSLEMIEIQLKQFQQSTFANAQDVAKMLTCLKESTINSHVATLELKNIYANITATLEDEIKQALLGMDSLVNDQSCFDDGIMFLSKVVLALNIGIGKHIDPASLPFDCNEKLQDWRKRADGTQSEYDLEGPDFSTKLKNLATQLDLLRSPNLLQRMKRWFIPTITYNHLCNLTTQKVRKLGSQGSAALRCGDYEGLQDNMLLLHLIEVDLASHLPLVKSVSIDIANQAIKQFNEILASAVGLLQNADLVGFEGIFGDIRRFAINCPFVFDDVDATAKFNLMNRLVHSIFSQQVVDVETLLEFKSNTIDFASIRTAIESARKFGSFLADYFILFQEEGKSISKFPKDEDDSFAKIVYLCHKYFDDGRDFAKISQFATLGVVPSASEEEIRSAKRRKTMRYASDSGQGSTSSMRLVMDAQTELLQAASVEKVRKVARPFDRQLLQLSNRIRTKLHLCLDEQRYEVVDHLLFSLPGVSTLSDLVDPELDVPGILKGAEDIVFSHVNKAKVEIQSYWSERKYRDLNDAISDLRSMEKHLKVHAKVFSKSWNDGLLETIENEIVKLGKECRHFLSYRDFAKDNESEFRRKFLQMGCVLVEIPSLKDFTKTEMSNVLECCLTSEWGFSYLFELGLSLQRGDEGDDDTSHVAHFILAEFSHFKEVLTMAWNTETSQKPVEDSVERIEAQHLGTPTVNLPIERNELLNSFGVFETQYNSLLGEYMVQDADKDLLTRKVVRLCKKFSPVPSSGGWTKELKRAIPEILAGVFALFTICKSGASFNRIEASSEASNLGKQILLKPHNIQVLTLLYMFGCGSVDGSDNLDSQLLQIRTGEGKSMILGAAATVLGLLGFKVRCVCYSEYLSNRDHSLFEEVFDYFGLHQRIKYSKITSLSEDMTALKGDIRSLTVSLLHGVVASSNEGQTQAGPAGVCSLSSTSNGATPSIQHTGSDDPNVTSHVQSLASVNGTPCTLKAEADEILLVDEVDVFFGSDFYGQTYNQVAPLREPEIEEILKFIWQSHKNGGRRLRLGDVQLMPAYTQLINKVHTFKFLVDNEISLMLDDVRRVDEEPYYLDANNRIGYKVMDTIAYGVIRGYQTAFAYLKELDAGTLNENDMALKDALGMNVSCGQFSYANINPARILGVSGTLEAMGTHEKAILEKYGIQKFIYMPSVYGASNFQFDKAGDGIYIESGQSDYFQKISSTIYEMTSLGRAVIVFFADTSRLNAFEVSSFYRKLGRKKAKLSEDMDAASKDFVIKKASTSGQLTICSAVFGRGTDFFSRDQKVQDNGGVHIIQTFLSCEKSEEIQIQGRTARQGKQGTYQLILLDSDLENDFDIPKAFKDTTPKKEWYQYLCNARDKKYSLRCADMDTNLASATLRDRNTHRYFDALLDGKHEDAAVLLKDIYFSMKNKQLPSSIEIDIAFVIDVTGSMMPYAQAAQDTIRNLLAGKGCIVNRLKVNFSQTDFKLRVGILAFRDIEDSDDQFKESVYNSGSHFTDNVGHSMLEIQELLRDPCGGHDIAEDLFGALQRCSSWNSTDDWKASAKFMILMTDAPAHGLVPPSSKQLVNSDSFPTVHPSGLTAEKAVETMLREGIDLFFCSFNPLATEDTESSLAKAFSDLPCNVDCRDMTSIPMLPIQPVFPGTPILLNGQCQHIIFVLDESGSMQHEWNGVVVAYRNFVEQRVQNQCAADLVSVVQFDSTARVSVHQQGISDAPRCLGYSGGGTHYTPAAEEACRLVLDTPPSHCPVVIFMSDGLADENDAVHTAKLFRNVNDQVRSKTGTELALHVIAFGPGMDQRQLLAIMRSSNQGRIHSSVNASQLSDIFIEIAKTTSDVAKVLEAEIGRRISEAVSDKVSLEYMG